MRKIAAAQFDFVRRNNKPYTVNKMALYPILYTENKTLLNCIDQWYIQITLRKYSFATEISLEQKYKLKFNCSNK